MTIAAESIDLNAPAYDPVTGKAITHVEWSKIVARDVRQAYGFEPGSSEEQELEQTAALTVVEMAKRFDPARVRAGGNPHMQFRGWAKVNIHKECQREAIRLRNGGTFNTTRTPGAVRVGGEIPTDSMTSEQRRRAIPGSARPVDGPVGVAIPLGDDPDVTYRQSPVGMTVEGEPTLQQWRGAVERLAAQQNGFMWALGDLLLYGTLRFGLDGKAAVSGFRRKDKTLTAALRTARRFEPGIRIPGLSWSHHQAVSALAPKRARQLLQRAVKENLSFRDLLDAVAIERGKSGATFHTRGLLTVAMQKRLPDVAPRYGLTAERVVELLTELRRAA